MVGSVRSDIDHACYATPSTRGPGKVNADCPMTGNDMHVNEAEVVMPMFA